MARQPCPLFLRPPWRKHRTPLGILARTVFASRPEVRDGADGKRVRRGCHVVSLRGCAPFFAAFFLLLHSGVSAAETAPEGDTLFETKIRPLLAENCFPCHGEKEQKGHLRLDSRNALLAGGENGAAL